jgi:hypothetical protein
MTARSLMMGLLLVASSTVVARADALLYGMLNTGGTATISLGSITFADGLLSINSPASSQVGGFTILEGTDGTILDIVNPPDAVGPLDVPDFVTFAADTNIEFVLTYLLPGIDGSTGCSTVSPPPEAGQVCTPDTPAQSPFNLQNTSATTSTASFNILGYELDKTTGDTTPITGTFSTPFTTMNFQQILSTVEGGGSVTTTFSAQFQAVPEPGTAIYLLLGIGALGMARVLRKSSRSRQTSRG